MTHQNVDLIPIEGAGQDRLGNFMLIPFGLRHEQAGIVDQVSPHSFEMLADLRNIGDALTSSTVCLTATIAVSRLSFRSSSRRSFSHCGIWCTIRSRSFSRTS